MKEFFAKLPQKIEKFRKKHPVPKKARKPLLILTLLAWTALASIGSQYLIAYGMLMIFGRNFVIGTAGTILYQVISYALTLIIVFLIPLKISKKARTNREEVGLQGLPTWTDIGLAPLGFAASVLLGMALAALFSLFPWFDAEQAQDLGFNFFTSGGERIMMFISVVVIAPIAEELIFRGWLYGKLRAKFGMILSILLTSLLFGVVHLQWNVAVNVFAVSVVLCILRELTGTIYSGIIVHMIKNGVAFFLVYIIGIS